MKKTIGVLAIAWMFTACTSDNDMKYKETDKTDAKTENPVGIQNVNGGIPDTVNTIDIGTHTLDTTLKPGKDSSK